MTPRVVEGVKRSSQSMWVGSRMKYSCAVRTLHFRSRRPLRAPKCPDCGGPGLAMLAMLAMTLNSRE